MSKVAKKINIWCSKEQYDYIWNYPNILSSEIQFYELNNNMKFYKSIKADKLHIPDTIKLFDNYSKENGLDFTFLYKVKNSLRSISKYDITFNFHGKNYLFHTYKVLSFIRSSVSAYLLSNDKDFIYGTIGDYNDREKEYYLSEYLYNREQLCKSNNIYKGASLINAFLYRSLYLHKDFTKYYLSFFAIIGINNMKAVDNDRLESKILKNTLKVFQSGKVTKRDCAKSLLSVLYYYFIFKMKINKNKALSIAKELVDMVFGIYYEYKGSEILKNVYVKAVIGTNIIYSFDTKKEHLTDENKLFLENIMTEHCDFNKKNFPAQIVKKSLDTPLRLYSLLTPSELLQKI